MGSLTRIPKLSHIPPDARIDLHEFIKADRKAKRLETELQHQFNEDRDKIRALEKEKDDLQLNVTEQRKYVLELQTVQTVLKCKMNANEDKYLDDVLNLEDKLKKNEDVVIKMSQSVQALFMLGPKPLSFYDPKLKHDLGYENPYTLKKAISQNPELYDASCLHISKVHVNVYDTEEIIEDATKSQIKIENKLKDPIVIEKKQNFYVTSVRRPSSIGSLSMKSIFSNTKNQSKDLEVYVRTNKKTNVVSKKNVVQNKKIVRNIDVKNIPKAKDVLCVSCDKNVLTPCHDKCLAKYKLNVNSNVRRALFTTPRTAKSKSLDTTPVVTKTRFAVVTPISVKNKDSSAFRTTSLFVQAISLSKYMKIKINTSRKWQKWYETQPNVGWSPKRLTDNANLSAVKSRYHVVTQIIMWIVDSGCSKHVTEDLKLLKYFVKKFMGTVRFGNDHFTAIACYGDYVHGNITICHVYYVEGLGHNLFNVGKFYDGDLEVAF
ncbi:hypothetical protein Tco_0935026 [Tanacetum coccineum]